MARTKKTQTEPAEIEIGDFVEVVAGPDHAIGLSGILDNVFMQDGLTQYAVVSECNADEFWYASEIRLFKKAAA